MTCLVIDLMHNLKNTEPNLNFPQVDYGGKKNSPVACQNKQINICV